MMFFVCLQVVVGARLESCKYLIEVEACNSKPATWTTEGPTDGNIEETSDRNIKGTTGGNIAKQAKKPGSPAVPNQTGPVAGTEARSTTVAKPVARVGLKRKHTVSIDTLFIK